MSNLLKWAIYCRVSTDEQEATWTSLQSQKLSNMKFASDNNLIVSEDHIFLEQYSWGFLDRPQLAKLLWLASKWLIDFVVFTKRDRVARDQYVFQKIMKDLQDCNVKVFYSEEKLTWDSAMDSFMWSTIIGFAAWEREQIKLRTNTWKRQYAKNNMWPFWHNPYGYIKNKKTKELEIFESEKEIILRIVKNFLEDNMTITQIAKTLTDERILPPSFAMKNENEKIIEKENKKNKTYFWNISNVHRILSKAEMYTWIYQAFKKQYKKDWNRSILISERPKQDWIEIKIPKILTIKQAEAIIEKLENNRRYSKKRSVRNYMLQWKLVCDCESPILHNFVWYFSNAKWLRNYRCWMHNSTKYWKERLCSNHISWMKIEKVVVDTLRELFLDPDYIFDMAIDKLIPWQEKKQKDRYTELHWLILELEDRHNRNHELYVDWYISKVKFEEMEKLLEKKKDEYSKEMQKEFEIMKNEAFKESAYKNINDIIKELNEEIEAFFDNASYNELKELVGLVVDKIIVPRNKENPVRIVLKIPWTTLSFQNRYYEDQKIIYSDDNGVDHVVWFTWEIWPKLLSLDPTKKPLKYRTVEFKNDDSWDSSDNESRFLKLIKEKFHQFCKLDHKWSF